MSTRPARTVGAGAPGDAAGPSRGPAADFGTPRFGCRDLEVIAGSRSILRVDHLDVDPGETLAVLGRNGAGKSTLLRTVAMLRDHQRGQVLLDGSVADRASMRAAVAAVLQRPVLRRGSVRMNAATGLRLRGVGRREAHRRAGPWLERLGIARLADRDVRTLSGGEAQRVSLARALAVVPRVLLLDEPFSGLDATTRSDLLADLRGALHGLDVTTLLVTHDRDEAAAVAGRMLLLVDGSVRQVGPTAQVLDQPADLDCARLIGFGNVLPAAATGLAGPGVSRPEHAIPRPPGADADAGAVVVAGRLRRVVPLGGVTRVDVDTDSEPLACLVPGSLPPALAALAPGGALQVAVPRSALRRVGPTGQP